MAAKRRKKPGDSRDEAMRSAAARRDEKPMTPIYVGGAVLVVGLIGLVWWSLPGDRAPDGDDGGVVETASSADEPEDAAPRAKNQIERPPRASAELAVITSKTEEEIRAIATLSEIGKRLEARHCGPACDAVRKHMDDEDAFDVDVMASEDLILPPKDMLDTIAAGLTPGERDSILLKKQAAVIRVMGNIEPNHLTARTAWATAAVLAEALEGFVYDETCRRIETKAEVLSHAVTSKLGEPVFSPRQIAVALHRQDEGTERMVSFGMVRFGAPDLVIRGASLNAGPMLSHVLNAAAAQLIAGKKEGPLTITLDDVAKVTGQKPADLNPNPSAARPVVLDLVEAEREDAEPDFLAELAPESGASRESWDLALASLFGAPPSRATETDDKELGEVAKRARESLPAAVERFQSGEGAFFVKGPFSIAEESRVDGGPANENLWVHVASCDERLCAGVLSSEPTYVTNVAPGKTVSVKRAEAVDWMLRQRDGGAAGGESIKALRARATGK